MGDYFYIIKVGRIMFNGVRYIFWNHQRNPLKFMQNLAGLLYVVNLYSSRCCKTNTIPVFFEDGKFVVQTEGVTKVWCECGDVYKLGIFKTYC